MLESPATPSGLSIGFSSTIEKDAKPKKKVEWSPENEKLLVEWCDVAQCYKWLNSRAHNKFSRMNTWFTIPAIIFSTISGTASFAQSSLTDNQKVYAPMVIGSVNILIGILTTIHQYLKISELNEAHRVSSIAWDKYARNIRIELSKSPDERPDAGVFLKHNRDEFDRLMETSPSIPEPIIAEFMSTFTGKTESDPERKKLIKDRFAKLKKPDICDIIISADETRHHWYKEAELALGLNEPTELEMRAEDDLLQRQADLRLKEQELHDKTREIEDRELREADIRRQRMQEEEVKVQQANIQLNEYVVLFNNTHGRKPHGEEIEEHFREQIEDVYIQMYLKHYGADVV